MISAPISAVLLALAGPLSAPPAHPVHPPLFAQLGLETPRLRGATLPWEATDATEADRASTPLELFPAPFDRQDGRWMASNLNRDPGWWRYRQVRSDPMYRRVSRLEMPDPTEVAIPFAGRNWLAEERMQIPVPVPIPVAEQLFVYGQVRGSGDALNNQATTLTGKTGVGLRWSLIGKSEMQLRYGTIFSYADLYGPPRTQDGAKPAVEVVATVPLLGPWELEYTGAALPAVSRADPGQFRQELRFALPIRGDGELEFGARYNWLDAPNTIPWTDRAQLFFGLKFRH